MPPTVWQCEGMLRWQYSQRPHLVMAGTSTRSPALNPLTASPTSVTVRSGVGADAAGRRAGEDVQEPGRAGIGGGDAEGVQRLAPGRARAVGFRVGTGKVAAVVGVPQQRTRTGSGFHRRKAAGRG